MRLKTALCISLLLFVCTAVFAQSGGHREFRLPQTEAFIAKWKSSGGSELGSSQLFIAELCDLIGIPSPDAPQQLQKDNVYGFEKQVALEGGKGRIDFYLLGKILWESKQGSFRQPESDGDIRKGTAVRDTKSWDTVMVKAREQAESYIKGLPKEEGRPPFLIVADIGYVIDIYADFTGNGYIPYPSARENRIYMDDFRKPEILELFRTIWTDPLSLDPSREREKVTNEIAEKLSSLAKSLEETYDAETVATFLMKAIFAMYAEDCLLIPYNTFSQALNSRASMEKLFSSEVLRLHGGRFFADNTALNLNKEQTALLAEAAKANWASVDTSIFGTLLRRALTEEERFKLGAYYTPSAYAERLIMPTIMESLRDEWDETIDAALEYVYKGDIESATAEVVGFHKELTEVVILDPASGSGNFLSLSLRMVKDLEGEVVQALRDLGQTENDFKKRALSVSSCQFRGIESNPLAASVSELVLKISYLQQHYKIHGNIPPLTPADPDFMSVECRDAVLAWDSVDNNGRYINPRRADPWPEAEYIVGNPPFIGAARMRLALGDGYVEALRAVYPELPKKTDYVMYWWYKAAVLVRDGKAVSAGFITTKSIGQTQNRGIVNNFMNDEPPVSIVMAIPDHPWAADGAQVRIAMTVIRRGQQQGILNKIILEKPDKVYFQTYEGRINANLGVGIDVTKLRTLKSNDGIVSQGIWPNGSGFLITKEEAESLGLGSIPGLDRHIKAYRNGRDIASVSRDLYIIDMYGLTEEEVKRRYPAVYELLLEKVKPDRETNNRKTYRENWWIFGDPGAGLRKSLEGLSRYIVTPGVSRRRYFVFLDKTILPDGALTVFCSSDPYILGVLSSKIHLEWVLATGGRHGAGNDPRYVKSISFDAFPFPEASKKQKNLIRDIAEKIDRHRKVKQQEYPELKLTEIYAVMEQITYGVRLNDKERAIGDKADVPALKSLHDQLDKAVFAAYGWSDKLTNEEILKKLFDLNQKRAKEEAAGKIKWLRPEFQEGTQAKLLNYDQILYSHFYNTPDSRQEETEAALISMTGI